MDTWLILYLMRKRGFAPPRRRPFRRVSLDDELTLLADILRVYYPFVLEDELRIADSLVKALKRLQLEDEPSVSGAVFNALRKIPLEDEISISDSLFNALRKISLEDEISIADSLKNVYKPLHLSDELVLAGACVKSLATGSTITLEDELTISDSLQLAYDTVKVLTLEDSLSISDSLKKSVTTIHLEDSLNISDSLKLAKREISLEDELNVNDSLKLAKRKIQLEDELNVADSLKLSVNKQTAEDELRIGDSLKIFVAESEEEICDFRYIIEEYEYDYINVFFVRSSKLAGYFYCVIFIDGRDTINNKHYYIGYTTANEIFTHCRGMVDYNCSDTRHCVHDYADESEFVGAVCGGVDWVVLLYQAGKSVTITPKYLGETVKDVCGYDRPAWSHFQGFVLYKRDGTKEYKSLEEFTVDYDTIKQIAFVR
ncbi:MAG: hypothetical protein ACXQTI_01195 [Candidatus Nezhaarchaeales archaeon]